MEECFHCRIIDGVHCCCEIRGSAVGFDVVDVRGVELEFTRCRDTQGELACVVATRARWRVDSEDSDSLEGRGDADEDTEVKEKSRDAWEGEGEIGKDSGAGEPVLEGVGIDEVDEGGDRVGVGDSTENAGADSEDLTEDTSVGGRDEGRP